MSTRAPRLWALALAFPLAVACGDDGTDDPEVLRGEPEMNSFTLASSEGASFEIEGELTVDGVDPFLFRMAEVTVTAYFSHPPPVVQGEPLWVRAFSEARGEGLRPTQMLVLAEAEEPHEVFATYWLLFEPTAATPELPRGFSHRYSDENDCKVRDLSCGTGSPFQLEVDLDQVPRAALCPEHSATSSGWVLANGISEHWLPNGTCADQRESSAHAGLVLRAER